MARLRGMMNRFRRDDGGYMVIEAVLVLPFLMWAFLALYTYWDSYRAATTIQKAAYAISDLISREQRPVNAAYVNGMRRAMDAMIAPRLDTELRVTSVVFNQANNRFEVQWSCRSGTLSPLLTTTSLQPLRNKIPGMSDGDTIILVETWVDYEPALNIGITEKRFSQFVVTRPRYAPQIPLSSACT